MCWHVLAAAVVHVDAAMRITNLEIFYDPHELMSGLSSSRNFSSPAAVRPAAVRGAATPATFLSQA